MTPILAALISKLGGAVSGALLAVGAQLLAGKAFRRLILWPWEKLAGKTKSTTDDKIVADAKEDLGLSDEEGKK